MLMNFPEYIRVGNLRDLGPEYEYGLRFVQHPKEYDMNNRLFHLTSKEFDMNKALDTAGKSILNLRENF